MLTHLAARKAAEKITANRLLTKEEIACIISEEYSPLIRDVLASIRFLGALFNAPVLRKEREVGEDHLIQLLKKLLDQFKKEEPANATSN